MADGNQDYEIVQQSEEAGNAPRRDLTEHLPENASIVERAVFAGMPLDVIDRLRIMAKEERQEAAKLAFMAAKVAAKAEIPRVLKGRLNSHTKSKYADLAAIDAAVTPVITSHGFTLDFTATPSERAGYIDVTCTTMHREGHSESFTLPWPLDSEGMKGNSNKTPVQAMKSTITFARRTMKMMAFDIADADDDDGNGARRQQEDLVGPEEMTILDDLLRQTNSDRTAFFDYAQVDGMADIWMKNFPHLRKVLERKLADQQKESEQ